MRFEAKLPDDSVNVTEGSAAREAIWLVVGVAATIVLVTSILAFSIEALVPMIPPALEVRLFSAVADTFSDDAPDEACDEDADRDPRASQVQSITDRLAAHWTDSPYPQVHTIVVDDPLPNAFALPGGVIAVTSGLLDRIETENELAFVLGHELGHFAGRDHLRGIGRGLAITIAWSAFGLSGDRIETLASSASALSSRHFDRNQESDADLVGLGLLVAEYGHAAGTSAVFERVLVDPDAEEETDDPGALDRLAGYLSTHPLGPDRIAALEAGIANAGWSATGPLIEWVPNVAAEAEPDP